MRQLNLFENYIIKIKASAFRIISSTRIISSMRASCPVGSWELPLLQVGEPGFKRPFESKISPCGWSVVGRQNRG